MGLSYIRALIWRTGVALLIAVPVLAALNPAPAFAAEMGPLGSAPSAATGPQTSGGNHYQYVFWQGTDDYLWEAYWNGSWQGPLRIGFNGLNSPPSVTVTEDGVQHVFWRGNDGALWQGYYNGHWNLQNLGCATLGSQPGVASDSLGDVFVFWAGSNGGLWERWFNSQTSTWSACQRDGNMGTLGSSPTVYAFVSGGVPKQEVFWKGSTSSAELWEALWTGGGWSGPTNLHNGPLGSGPSDAVSPDVPVDNIFWQGADNNLWEFGVSGPQKRGYGPLGSRPGAAGSDNGRIYVFWEGTDRNLWEVSWNGSSWSGQASQVTS
jgi:hypothetical protein